MKLWFSVHNGYISYSKIFLLNLLQAVRARKKRAISEVMGSLLMIAITLVAGTAIFGFVNGQSSNSAAAVGNSAAQNINFLNEREVVVYATYQSSTTANIWIYNNGNISPEYMTAVLVTASNPAGVCTVNLNPTNLSPPPVSVAKNALSSFTLDVSGCGGFTFQQSSGSNLYSYTFKVIGFFGSSAQLPVQF